MSEKQNEILKKTITATFIFPLLEIPKSIFECEIKNNFNRLLLNNRFINAYLFNNTIDKYQDLRYIYIVINNYQDPNFEAFYTTLTGFTNFIDDYFKFNLLIMIFEIPKQHEVDYNLLLRGKYSEISKKGKELILANHMYHGNKITVPLVLSKSKELKESWEERLTFIGADIFSPVDLGEQEVWSILNKEQETLTDEKLTNLYRETTVIVTDQIKQ